MTQRWAVTIDVAQIALLDNDLSAMVERISDFSIPLTDGAKLILADVMSSFDTGGTSIGESWDPLAQSTIDRMQYSGGKSGSGFGQGPTGNLFDSIGVFVREFVAGVEATAPHAHLFENGHYGLITIGSGPTQIKRKHDPTQPTLAGFHAQRQPGREFLKMTEATVLAIEDLILDYAVGNFGQVAA